MPATGRCRVWTPNYGVIHGTKLHAVIRPGIATPFKFSDLNLFQPTNMSLCIVAEAETSRYQQLGTPQNSTFCGRYAAGMT